jgi:hypothetical protein
MKNISVYCRGITPLFMNRMSESVLENIRTKTKEAKTKRIGSVATPRDEAAPKVYMHANEPIIPATNLMSCLIAAGVFVRLDAKRQISTGKSTILPGFLSLDDAWIPLLNSKGGQATWEADVRQGRNPNGGEAVAICRPRFDDWAFRLHIGIDTSEIGENVMRDLWDKAGRRIGMGDFRPARKGIFGQFVIDEWSPVEDERVAAE